MIAKVESGGGGEGRESSGSEIPTLTRNDRSKSSGFSSKSNFSDAVEISGFNPFTGKPYSSRYFELLRQREKLPAYETRKHFLRTVRKNQCVVLVGETGSGKTTQCPQFLLLAGMHKGKCVGCTQPRRVAAISVARRVAEEMDTSLGETVGYRVRFEDVSAPGSTLLKYCTDGSLLREAQTDPSLSSYSIIIVDEAHERTLDTDILFGLLKDVMKSRLADLKVIIMSATLDAEKFQKYFNAPIIHIPGRVHPVDILYTPKPEPNYFDAALRTVLQIHATEAAVGDILLFLTGEEEIDQMKKSLERDAARLTDKHGELVVIPLHSSLPPAQQQKIFEPAPGPKFPGGPPGRKCVVSTNLAETSITIDGIVYVVDPGFSKQKVYNPRTRMESLVVAPISKASAQQRAGRLYTETSYERELKEQTYPEILRCNLTSVVLTLLKLGVGDLVHFDFMEPPAPETLMRALEQLNYLGALTNDGALTPEGELMAELPLEPQLARMLVESSNYFCTPEMFILTAVLSVPQIFLRPRDQSKEADSAKNIFADELGDHFTILNVFEAYKRHVGQEKEFCWEHYLHPRSLAAADKVREQLVRIYKRLALEVLSTENDEKLRRLRVRKGLLAGFFMQVAHSSKNNIYFTMPDNQAVALHPSCVIKHQAEWVVFHEFVSTQYNFIRVSEKDFTQFLLKNLSCQTCTQVEGEWLSEISPEFWDVRRIPDGDARRRLIQIEQRKTRTKQT